MIVKDPRLAFAAASRRCKEIAADLDEVRAPINANRTLTVAVLDAVRDVYQKLPDSDSLATDPDLALEEAAASIADEVPDLIANALELFDEQLDKARELAEYVVELVDALEGDPELGLGENDHHARRIARDLLRDMPPGAPISVAP